MQEDKATKNVQLRKCPVELLDLIDAYAAEVVSNGKPSREVVMLDLLRRGLADAKRKR